jgi:hypothetical protein
MEVTGAVKNNPWLSAQLPVAPMARRSRDPSQ